MAFLSWLLSQGHSLAQVAQAMVGLGDGGTLAQVYAQLTGQASSDAWVQFTAAVNALPGGVTSDDPFNALGAPPREVAPMNSPVPNHISRCSARRRARTARRAAAIGPR